MILQALPQVVRNPDIVPLFSIELASLEYLLANHIFKKSNLALKTRLEGRSSSDNPVDCCQSETDFDTNTLRLASLDI